MGPALQGLRLQQAVDQGEHPRRRLPRLQRPCHSLQPGDDPDLRHRHRGAVPAGRRRLGPAAGAEGDRSSRPRLAHRAERDPGRLRPDHREQDGRRPRPDRAAVADVRPDAALALQGDSLRRERGAVPGAVGPALLPARPGDPACGGKLRRAAQGADLGHRGHEPPAAGRARRAHQPALGHRLRRTHDCRPRRAGAGAPHRATCAKPAPRASSSSCG